MSTERMLEEKVVLVTGGTRGIGRAIVLEAAAAGARVAFCGRTAGAEMDAVAAELERLAGPGRVLARACDVTREEQVEALFDATLETFGRVDVSIHNAGINRDELLVYSSTEVFEEVLATNLTGAFLVSRRAVQEYLAAGEGGRILFTGSLSDKGATSQTAYSASKGGLRGLCRTIAKEYGHKGIYANMVVVGLVDTQLSANLPPQGRQLFLNGPLRRPGAPEEIAAAMLYLASPRASFINGEALYASGGLVEVNA
jgi:NAD(P)-dependent dehydrogenase (short-subunit alcohol dehydrogenase family)